VIEMITPSRLYQPKKQEVDIQKIAVIGTLILVAMVNICSAFCELW
jgi:hypothetical protein